MADWIQADPVSWLRDVEVFAQLAWPVAESSVDTLIQRLGWSLWDEQPGLSIRADTGYGMRGQEATFSSDSGELAEVDFRITEGVSAESPERSAFMRDAFAHGVAGLTSLFGPRAKATAGGSPSCIWDLPNGGRVDIRNSQTAVWVGITSPAYAQVQRELGG